MSRLLAQSFLTRGLCRQVKGMSKAEKLGYVDKAKVEKMKVEKEYEAAMKVYEEELKVYEAEEAERKAAKGAAGDEATEGDNMDVEVE